MGTGAGFLAEQASSQVESHLGGLCDPLASDSTLVLHAFRPRHCGLAFRSSGALEVILNW